MIIHLHSPSKMYEHNQQKTQFFFFLLWRLRSIKNDYVIQVTGKKNSGEYFDAQ